MDATTSWRDKTTIQREGGTSRGDATTSRCDERTKGWRRAQRENEERRCDNKLAQRVGERVAQREDGERQCDNQLGERYPIILICEIHCHSLSSG